MNPLALRALVLALSVLGALVGVTFSVEALMPLSGFATGLFKAALAVGAFWAFDRFVLPGDACEEILERRNVAYGLLLVALGLILAATVATAQSVPPRGDGSRGPDGAWAVDGVRPWHVVVARSQVGVVEVGGANRGRAVEAYQRSVGIPPGSAWCAAFVRWVLDHADADVVDARGASIESGVATVWLRGHGTIPARDVQRGLRRPPRGSVVVWRRGATWQGHLGLLDWWDRGCGETVEGNTSRGTAGSQREGDGVWARTRCLSPASYVRIVGFVPVRPSGLG